VSISFDDAPGSISEDVKKLGLETEVGPRWTDLSDRSDALASTMDVFLGFDVFAVTKADAWGDIVVVFGGLEYLGCPRKLPTLVLDLPPSLSSIV